jgi:flagellar biosynthesis protein FlhG
MNNLRGKNRFGDQTAGQPRLYAIASGKGGVGKSVIAFNLAHYLARTHRVLLIDGDFQMGNQHLLANIVPEHGWQGVCSRRVNWSEAIRPVMDNLDLLASSGGQSDELLPDMKCLAESLGSLRKWASAYDYVIIDTASGILPHTNLILNAVDEVVLVATPELTSISDCYALYKILISNNEHLVVSLLVNREDRKEEVDYVYQKFIAITVQFLGHSPSFFGFVGDDEVLVDSVARQQGVAEIAPESKISKHFTSLAEGLTGRRPGSRITPETINLTPLGADIKE